ncbi:MAG: DUF1549 and DUF1553 domain-containing protein [Planctomycetia bacterium]|nr:DUF1549 and DUF1553 domain-containing protein [Planctomycetia bacterium]
MKHRCKLPFVLLVVAGLAAALISDSASAADDLARVAAEVDRLLGEEALRGKPLAPPVDDAAYLRRISLDIVGEPPGPAEITSFVLDPAPDKRRRMVDQLLTNPQYGQNWARYWRDVIMARRSDERALVRAGNSATVYLTEQFNKGAGWDQIARSLVTATGDVRHEGSTALLFAQEGKPEETAAEAARVLLGFELQCAQCHNHPYDDWKREQFHEFAAFFPRVVVRPLPNDIVQNFEITSLEKSGGGGKNKAKAEHYMPDLKNPQAQGTLMQPVFFLSGQALPPGMTDKQRRQTLARWITARENPWFAKAYVNRVWAELLGRGFYETVDDLGAKRKCAAPRTVEYLSQRFVENGYDLRWLLRTISSTAAYQRASKSRGESDATPFTAVVIQPLRSDVLFSALTSALGANELESAAAANPKNKNAAYGRNGPRFVFEQVFGFDPSVPREEVSASISQALLLMNGPQLSHGLKGDNPQGMLGKLLLSESHDDLVATELYLRTLSREPSEKELAVVIEHVHSTSKRSAAFEDVLWALINSAEFRQRR